MKTSRLPKKKIKVDVNGCHIWQGSEHHHGYARIYLNKKRVYVHKVAYEDAHGPRPNGQVIRHLCGNTRCVNPTHLTIGTQKQNCSDTVAMGRSTRGVKNAASKLTDSQILEIRELAESNVMLKDIATKFNVSRSLISMIVNRKRWEWL